MRKSFRRGSLHHHTQLFIENDPVISAVPFLDQIFPEFQRDKRAIATHSDIGNETFSGVRHSHFQYAVTAARHTFFLSEMPAGKKFLHLKTDPPQQFGKSPLSSKQYPPR